MNARTLIGCVLAVALDGGNADFVLTGKSLSGISLLGIILIRRFIPMPSRFLSVIPLPPQITRLIRCEVAPAELVSTDLSLAARHFSAEMGRNVEKEYYDSGLAVDVVRSSPYQAQNQQLRYQGQ